MAWPTKTDFVDGDVLTAAQVNNIGTNLNVFNPTSATNGQVLTANGAGSAAYQTLSAGGWTLINSGTLSGASITSSAFSGYKQIHIDLAAATHAAGANLQLRMNGLSTTIYGVWSIGPTSTTAVYNYYSVSDPELRTNGLALSSTDPYSAKIDIYNADTATALKVVSMDLKTTNASINQKTCYTNGYASISAALTSVTLLCGGSTWSSGSYYIYGLK